jgi:hypothetical protein
MATPTNLPGSFSVAQVLTAANMNNLRGAFRILQVVEAGATSFVASTTTTYADTGVTATITPQATSSKILVIHSTNIYSNGAVCGASLRLVRGSTELDRLLDLCYGTNSGLLAHHTACYLDSPNTTSATTYKTQFARTSGGSTIFVQPNSNRSTIVLMEISA